MPTVKDPCMANQTPSIRTAVLHSAESREGSIPRYRFSFANRTCWRLTLA